MNPRLIIVVACAVSLIGFPAGAEELEEVDQQDVEQEDQDDLERAQAYFDDGAEHFYEGRYGRAAVEFRRAHEIHPHPLFLYNFALASVQTDRLDDALDAAIEADAMEEPLPQEQHSRNRALISGASTVFAAEDAAERIDELGVDPPEEPEPPEDLVEADDPDFGLLGWTGVAALGAGAAGLVLGGLTHHNFQPAQDEVDQRMDRNPDDPGVSELDDWVSGQQTLRNVYFISGAALMVAGAGLVIWESGGGGDDAEPAAMQWNIHPGGAGVTVQW